MVAPAADSSMVIEGDFALSNQARTLTHVMTGWCRLRRRVFG
jgi:hypothetical protein